MIPSLVRFAARGDYEPTTELLAEVIETLERGDADGRLQESLGVVDRVWQRTHQGPDPLKPLQIRRLVPTRPSTSIVSVFLTKIEPRQLVPLHKSLPDAISVRAGLFLIHDLLDESHIEAQAADEAGRNSTAPYWHGIMHRREPDYDNARYWFRRVGDHPIFPLIGCEVGGLLSDPEFTARLRFPGVIDRRGHWDPMAFIELCEQCGTTWDERSQAAARLQEIEMRLLLEYSCRAALGKS
jgi:hypothetical protein